MQRLAPDFVIVGTPRSGTTLVQRLASEIPGVVVPPETHFFSEFYRGVIRRRRFPLNDSDLREELVLYQRLTTSNGLDLDVEKVLDLLQGSAAGPGDFYGALTRSLAGPAALVGEKTPDHLRWWKPLSGAYGDMRVVGVVRDPRGVVASRITAGWGAHVPELLAARWRLDQRELARAASSLGPARYLPIRYEDAVTSPDKTREALAKWLAIAGAVPDGGTLAARRLFLPWEHWKERAAEPVTTDRIRAWTEIIDPDRVPNVLFLCRAEMIRLGYWSDAEEEVLAGRRPSISPELRIKIARMTLSRRRERHWISRQKLSI
ncbi:MAG TPA: sulfotransferase [Acidimicrobiia bacterium]|nr:sulfotransferase [Acidimicrobiia bacterium]